MLLDSKSRRVQCLSESNVAQLAYVILIVNETSSSVTVPPTKQGPCSDSARLELTPETISKTSRIFIGQRVQEIGRKLRRRTFASASSC